MGEIINLRMARKARRRAEDSRLAAENRARFGQARADRLKVRTEADRLDRTVEGAKRDRAENPDGDD